MRRRRGRAVAGTQAAGEAAGRSDRRVKTIAVFNVKGGVGKTATAVNLAYAAARQGGRRTLLWDLDAQGAATFTLRLKPRAGASARKLFAGDGELAELIQASDYPNLDVLAADKSLRHLERTLVEEDKAKRLRKMLKAFEGEYDRIVIDCPPGLTELAEQIFRAADAIVVPMLPSPLSTRAYGQLVEHLARAFRGKPPQLVPVYTMVDRRKSLHRAVIDADPDRPTIPYAAQVEAMAVHQAPVAALAPSSAPARAFSGLWAEVERALA